MSSIPTFATMNLSVEDQFRLITDAQNVPTEVTTDDDGNVRVIYGSTPASEAALTTLYTAFRRAIRNAASKTKRAEGREEAESVATEAFFQAVRDFDLTLRTGFHQMLPGILRHAVALHDRTDDAVHVPGVAMARYWRLLHDHSGDANAAYEAANASHHTDGVLLSQAAFLAIHNIIRGIEDADALDLSEALAGADPAAAVSWMFSALDDAQKETILRLHFGFDDLVTENLRVTAGFRSGERLSDREAAPLVGLTRPTTQRRREAAISEMRAAWDAAEMGAIA